MTVRRRRVLQLSRKEQLGFGAGEGGEECTGSACILTVKRTDIDGLDVECDRN